MTFTYVYILQSEVDPERFYTGSTTNLRERLKRHNDGSVPHTSKWRPWRLNVGSTARGRTGEVFEVALWPRIREEAPLNL
jgi:predicted GIY-YIG superfamily endonuclease